MSVSAISNTTTPNQNNVPSGFNQITQDFQALSNALQSNNLSNAQQAFAAVQKDIQNVSQGTQAAQALGQNTQLGQDFQALQNALQSNNLTAAKQAFANLQKDLKANGPAGAHRHPKAESENDGDGDDGGQSSSSSNTGASAQSGSATFNQLA